ncbi:MAG: P-loop NTPase family protein [Planctomycetota bacterium]|jgi:adenylate kinase family enzyme
MKRVVIVGCGGAGKSTLARRMGELLGLEVINLDHHYWRSGWEPMPDDEWDAALRKLLDGDAWIMDGNYHRTMSMRFERADTIVFLDLPRRACVWGVLRRQLRGQTQGIPGCPDKVDGPFLRWIWTYPGRRPAVYSTIDRYREGRRVEILRSRRAIAGFVASISAAS